MRKHMLLFLLLLVLPSPALAADGIREHVVIEPVFRGQAYVQEAGPDNAPGVLLVHGLGDEASAIWSRLIPKLAETRHVVAVDLPGFGKSEKQNELYSPSAYAAFLKWVADRYLPEPFVVVGHSLGGAVALKFAAAYPRGVERLIVADVAGILHRRVYTREIVEPGLREHVPRLPAALPRLEKVIGGLIAELPEAPGGLDMLIENRFMRGKFLGGAPAKIAALALIEEDFSLDLRQVDVPCLVLWGEHDTVTPRRTGILLESVLADATLHTISGAGHVPMRDRPEIFDRLVLEAVAGSPPPRAKQAGEHRVGTCTDQNGMIFRGRFERIEISGCRGVVLKDVRTARVDIRRSEVVFEQGELRGEKTALNVSDSSVEATGTRIEAEQAIVASRSRLDLAGVELIGRDAALATPDRASAIFSVSHLKSRSAERYLHGPVDITAENPL